MYAHRPVVDKETYSHAADAAADLGVPTRLLIDACVESVSPDPFVANNAEREISAWKSGNALDISALSDVLGGLTDKPVLLLAATNYRAAPSAPSDPFARAGYGLPASATTAIEAAPLVRGYLPIRAGEDEVLMIAFRRGIPRLVATGSDWTSLGESRKKYAGKFGVALDGRWVNVDNRRSRPKMSEGERRIEEMVSDLVIKPTGNRNPVAWVRPQ